MTLIESLQVEASGIWASYDCQIVQAQKDITIMIVIVIIAGGGFGQAGCQIAQAGHSGAGQL